MVPARPRSVLLVALVVVSPLVGTVSATSTSSPVSPTSTESTAPRLGAETGGLLHDSIDDADGNVTVLRGSASLFGTLQSSSEIRSARANGSLQDDPVLVAGDLLVAAFDSSRFLDRLEAAEGDNTTDRFFAVRNTSDTDFDLEGRSHGTSQLPADIGLNRSNTVVVADRANDTVWVQVDTTRVDLVERDDRESLHRDLHYFEFEAVVVLSTDGGDDRVLTGEARFLPPMADMRSPDAGTYLQSRPATIRQNETSTLTVRGTTPLLDGTVINVSAIRPDGQVIAADRVRTGTSNESIASAGYSEYEATLPLGGIDEDAEFDLGISQSNRTVERSRVAVGDPARMWNLSATYQTDGDHAGMIAVSATLSVPDSGLLQVQSRDYAELWDLPADRTIRRTVYVPRKAVTDEGAVYVLAMWDANDNGMLDSGTERLFWTSADIGASRTDDELDALVTVSDVPETPTTTSTTSTTSTTATPSTEQRPTTTGTTETSTTIPGFGWVVGLVAIASAVLLSRGGE